MRVVLSTLAVALFGVSQADERCIWQYWNETDFPGVDQYFPSVIEDPYDYFNSTDFEEGERFENEEWRDRFWMDPEIYRPLGFRYAKLYPQNEKFPCFKVHGAGGHKVELMLETFQVDAPVSVVDLDKTGYYRQEEGDIDGTGAEQYYHCFTANTDEESTLRVGVICETNCEDVETDMLWRFRRSSLTWTADGSDPDTNVDMWCNMIASKIMWPSEIQEGTPREVDEAQNENLNGVNKVSVNVAFALVSMLVGFIVNA